MVMEYLPHLEFTSEDMQMFPAELLMDFKTIIDDQEEDDDDFSLHF